MNAYAFLKNVLPLPLRDRLAPVRDLFGPRRRRWWRDQGRLSLELRQVSPRQQRRYLRKIQKGLRQVEGVERVGIHPFLGQIIVEGHPRGLRPRPLLKALDALEASLGIAEAPYFSETRPHPADDSNLHRLALELWADGFSFLGALLLRLVQKNPFPLEIDAAALLALLENSPRVRAYLEKRLPAQAVDLGLNLSSSLANALAQGPLSSVVDFWKRSLATREFLARRQAFRKLEGQWFHLPFSKADFATRPARSSPLPAGPIERYSDKAWQVSLGAFGLGALSTQSLQKAAGAIYGGLPKPALLGREAFAAILTEVLSAQDITVLEPEALRLLEKVDTVLLQASVFRRSRDTGPEFERLVALLHRSKMKVLLHGSETVLTEKIQAHRALPKNRNLVTEIRALQARGHVVLFASAEPTPALRIADLGVGLADSRSRLPWESDILAGPRLFDLCLIIEACLQAKESTRRGVQISQAAAVVGFLLAGQGLKERTTTSVMNAVNLASLLAMSHGLWSGKALGHFRPLRQRVEVPWHKISATKALRLLKSSMRGLSETEAHSRNHRAAPKPSSFQLWRSLFVSELRTPLTPILSAGAVLSAIVGSLTDAGMVLTVLGMNAAIGAFERLRGEAAVHLLGQHQHRRVRALRSGREHRVLPGNLVPGDVILLEAGEMVPVDARLLESTSLEIDESSMTGESLPVAKSPPPAKSAQPAERSCMIYAGTAVLSGKCKAVVTAVGEETEAHRSLALQPQTGPSGVEARLKEITSLTIPLTLVSGAAMVAAGLMHGKSINEVLNIGVSLAVAAIPEGLPILATLAQVAAARRLSYRGILTQNLRAIETLGRIQVICLDKTGTLTEGKIQLDRVSNGFREEDAAKLTPDFRKILATALRACPLATGKQQVFHRTDQALLDAARRFKIPRQEGLSFWKLKVEIPFDPARMYHASLAPQGKSQLLCVKGSPEVVISRCAGIWKGDRAQRLGAQARTRLLVKARELAREGFRILAVADRSLAGVKKLKDAHVHQLNFRGLVAFSDPIRETAPLAIERITQAGVRVVMATGDHPSTAERVAAKLGILKAKRVITGENLDRMSDAELAKSIEKFSVFARVTPLHKGRIVQAYQKTGLKVAMTGDGSNDAAAIRLADVGIAVTTRATQVAREAADLILTDDRVETIAEVVLEGRALWSSVREAVSILVGGNLGEIGFTVLVGLFSRDPPLSARQLLLMNLLTDVVPAIVIASKTPKKKFFERARLEGPQASLGSALNQEILWRSLVSTTSAGATWIFSRLLGSPQSARTSGLLSLVGTQLGQTLTVGKESPAVWGATLGSFALLAGIVQTPGLSGLFGCRPLGPIDWISATGSAFFSTLASVFLPKVFPGINRRLEHIPIGDLARRLQSIMPKFMD